jgi:hypothetical protein
VFENVIYNYMFTIFHVSPIFKSFLLFITVNSTAGYNRVITVFLP